MIKGQSKFGFEFEMAVYATNSDSLILFKDLFLSKIGSIGCDGSVDSFSHDGFFHDECYEVRSPIITKPRVYIKKIIKLLKDCNDKGLHIYINESPKVRGLPKKAIRIDFNRSTGTHIHYSKGDNWYYHVKKLRDLETIKYMINYFRNNIKYPAVKRDFVRGYARMPIGTNSLHDQRYNCINTTCENYNTIEFRGCNLHGVKTAEFEEALLLQVDLVRKTLSKGFKMINKKTAIKTPRLKTRDIILGKTINNVLNNDLTMG